ncbi:MAG: HAMP domain-containing histidine kinase [Oscillospiraceae bacterium]|nr:HAMP domain-containing histidine kinase [Oscillospiraceae bacterium]
MKKILIFVFIALGFGLAGTFALHKNDILPIPDMVALNDAVMTAMQGGDSIETVDMIANKLMREYETMNAAKKSRDFALQVFLCVYMAVFAGTEIFFYLYCERSVLRPFRKLRRFAKDVAMGNLDMPLEMDMHGRFGAFTESFDLMREELKKARENERAADRSKKELVASLSHDIKTPIASIKAAAELMLLKAKDEKEKIQLERINEKTEQINLLVTDVFHATLEELQELSVTVAEIQSTAIPQLIQNADYKGKAGLFCIPQCIVLADPARLQQVFDNIISNSYKYAGTDIEINAIFEDRHLVIDIMDFGPGAPGEELPFLFNKFYRGKNAGDKSGYGLGLHISKFLIEQMSGSLRCENRPGGFAVTISLRLA